MNEKELRFLQGHFQHYYRHHTPVPADLSAREFGFGWQKKIDYRHAALASHKEIAEFFVREAPLFASYSTAYYQFPSKKPVSEKGYLGADLVFDLDKTEKPHDHQAFFCRACLHLLHGEAVTLHHLLKEDFGFESELVFSGQKGFHLHVRGDSVRNLSKDARRQISDYICAQGLSEEKVFQKIGNPESPKQVFGPSEQSLGWNQKIYQLMRKCVSENEKAALRRFGCGRNNLRYIEENKEQAIRNLQEPVQNDKSNWTAVCQNPKLDELIKEVRIVQTDRAVTYDLSRLIRLPNSLHGNTGFLAKTLAFDKPFQVEQAVVFPDSPILEVRMLEDAEFSLFRPYALRAGKLEGVPLNVAVFLMGQGKATLP